jgi:hypothetical protein
MAADERLTVAPPTWLDGAGCSRPTHAGWIGGRKAGWELPQGRITRNSPEPWERTGTLGSVHNLAVAA